MVYVQNELTLNNLLRTSVGNNRNQKIIDSEIGEITYEKFLENVENLSRGLVKIGVKQYDKVAVLDWDTIRYLELYYAIPMAGATIHTVNIRYPVELIYYTLQHAEDTFLIMRLDIAKQFVNYKDLFGFVKGWVIYDLKKSKETLPFSNVYDYDDVINMGKDTSIPLPFVSENDYATIFYTSGSTGMPKGVRFRHRDVVLHATAVSISLGDDPININSESVLMPLVPMFHVHAWGFPHFFLLKGLKYVLPGRYDPKRILELIKKYRVTHSAMVPSILYMLINTENASEILKNSGLKAIIGGAVLKESLMKEARKFGVETISGYGMSETAPVLTLSLFNDNTRSLSDEERDKFRVKAGIPASFVELKIVDKNGDFIREGKDRVGEIVVRAPWLTSEYYKDQESTKKLWENGWLHTGDLGYVDKFGYLNIVDREKDAVKSGGEFIPSLILEDVISLYGKIKEVAVVAKKDEKWGERPVAFYTSDQEINNDEIRNFLMKFVEQKRIEKFWIPDEFIRISEMPKGSTNKVDKKILREKLRQN